MSGFGEWAKSNTIVIVSVAIPLLAVPAMIFFSMRWNASIQEQVETEVSAAMNDLNRIDVEYRIPAVLPGQEPFSLKRKPNQETTRIIGETLAHLKEESDRLRSQAVEWNARGKGLLVDEHPQDGRLFPEPANDSAHIRLSRLFLERWVESHETLLDDSGLRPAPAPQSVLEELRRHESQIRNRMTRGRPDGTLTAEEEESLKQELTNKRRNMYSSRADTITAYADPSVFASYPEVRSDIEGDSTARSKPVERLWELQEHYWLHQDIAEAVVTANLDASGVPNAPVKRILSVNIHPLDNPPFDVGGSEDGGSGRRGGGSASGDQPQQNVGDGSQPIPPDYTVAFTGRSAFPITPNGLYDIRYIDIELIADSARVPTIINAFSHVNFMTVIDNDMIAHDSYADLLEGYEYGDSAVVRLSMRIEAVMMRDWRTDRMPPALRTKLGLPEKPEPENAGEQPAGPDES